MRKDNVGGSHENGALIWQLKELRYTETVNKTPHNTPELDNTMQCYT